MMKQSTLLGSFIISDKGNAKAIETQAKNETNDKNAHQKVSKSRKSNQDTDVADGKILGKNAGQIRSKNNVVKNAEQAAAKNKLPRQNVSVNGACENKLNTCNKQTDKLEVNKGKRNASGKLSLSCKENESAGVVQKSAGTVESKAVAYSDFLAEVEVSEAVRSPGRVEGVEKENAMKKTKPEEVSSERSTMSYSDFLSLFKPAPKENVSLSEATDTIEDVAEVATAVSDTEQTPVTPQCRSILSFFSKSSSSEKSKNTLQCNSVRVVADVHSRNESVKSKAALSPLKRKSPVVATPKHDKELDTIEYLGSEIVAGAENTVVKVSQTKKRRNNEETTTTAGLKKQKVLDATESTEISMEVDESSQDDCSKDLTPPRNKTQQSTLKTSQSQLSFGSGGLTIAKAKLDVKTKQESCEKEHSEKKKPRGRPRKVLDVQVNGEEDSTGDIEPNQPMEASSKSEASSTETKTDTPRVTLRRSSRTVRPVKPFMIQEVVKVDDDDEEEDEEENQGSSRMKRQRCRKKSCESEKVEAQSSKRKPKGPLAPIFTSMKPKEESPRPPPEDPEKVRLRREFMMSGIPDELKRQIATNVSSVVTDYPPFPNPSHVQQLDRETAETSGSTSVTCPVTVKDGESKPPTIAQANLCWADLAWEVIEDSEHLQFSQSSQTNPALTESQQKYLLKKWQEKDPQFNFDKTMGRLMLHLKSPSETSDGVGTQKPVSESSGEDDIVVVEDCDSKPGDSVKKTAHPNVCLWPDLHQPASSEQIIGNTAVLEQLKTWLQDWKTVMQRDIRKASKASATQAGRGKGKGGWSDDSDFTDSDEEEDECLCNTMLVTGPHGVGKTSLVYALAEEMGYKVFEVNSSSLRSGKQILSQLEEATQSHRVAPSKPQQLTALAPCGTAGHVQGDTQSKKASSKSMASAFAALFQTPASSAGKCKDGKKDKTLKRTTIQKDSPCSDISAKEKKTGSSKKKSKNSVSAKKAEPNSDVSQADGDRSQNLASISLILFDEVDVVFEEDKGFLSTIEHFMATTKIPIILTSTAPASSLELAARHDHIVVKTPPQVSSVSYLCCVCLAHGIPVARHSVARLWQLLGGDLRKCLLFLQFWCLSGGGNRPGDKLKSNSGQLCPVSEAGENLLSASQDSYSSKSHKDSAEVSCSDDSNDGQFLSLRRPVRKARKMVINDDDDEEEAVNTKDNNCDKPEELPRLSSSQKRKRLSTKKSGTGNTTHNPESSTVSVVPSRGQAAGWSDVTSGSGVELHLGLAETFLGLSQGGQLSSQTFGQFLQCPSLSSSELHRFLQVMSRLACDSLYQVTLHMTSVPKCEPAKVQLTLPAPRSVVGDQQRRRRRILEGSWLDSDSSDAESTNTAGSGQQKEAREGNNNLDNDTERVGQTCPDRSSKMKLGGDADGTKSHEDITGSPREGQTCSDKSNEDKNALGETETEQLNNRTSLSMLASLSEYYDCVSLLDTVHRFYSKTDTERHLAPSICDEDTSSATAAHSFGSGLSTDLPGTITLLTSRALYRNLDVSMKAWKSKCKADSPEWPDELCLPVGKNAPELWGCAARSHQQRSRDSTTKNVVGCLGAAMLQNDPVVHLDYLPYLRDICRSEDARHQAKTQRRFHHYLDNVGLSLKKSTVACLSSTYTIDNSR
ncbi:ATPase family AAA domain-containing protein 5 [Elysia marginata]|uniref:ATPase family AAA domain-containing protein 5 n=1 Tax=Elysia marginata TaxID=1093978 RepID=A0AAV4II39_9GAST|nr:ATPase family AAA domain-containing protein 5 [Elysia marginata]